MGLRGTLCAGLLCALFAGEMSLADGPRAPFIVFDIDTTIAHGFYPGEPVWGQILPDPKRSGPGHARKATIRDQQYRLFEGAPEIVQSVATDRDFAGLGFFSGGSEDRNFKLLDQARRPDRKSFRESAARILSLDALDRPDPENRSWIYLLASPPEGVDYRLKHDIGAKDLRKMLARDPKRLDGIDISHVILIDDRLDMAVKGQEKNLLWVGNVPPVLPESLDGAQVVRKFTGETLTAEKFVQSRNKLTFAQGLLDRAWELAQAEKIPVTEALWKLQWKTDAAGLLVYRAELLTDMDLYRRGLRLLRATGSTGYRFVPALPGKWSKGCGLRQLLE